MTRRALLSLLLALAALGQPLLALPVRADDGTEDADDDGDEIGDEEDEDEEEDEGGEDEADDADSESGGGTIAGKGKYDHDDALQAVHANGALPLRRLLVLFDSQLQGNVVDVTLIRSTDALRYRVKFIDPAGRVRRAYFNAVTGELIR